MKKNTSLSRRAGPADGSRSGIHECDNGQLLRALMAFKRGDFSVRLPDDWTGVAGKIADTFNEFIAKNQRLTMEPDRIGRAVGKKGRITQRASLGDVSNSWADAIRSVNGLIGDLVHPTSEMARVIGAVAKGDLSKTMATDIEGRQLEGEFLRTAKIVNTMVDQLGAFADEVTRVAREVGTEGKLGGQAHVRGVAGTWKDLTENVNQLAGNLTTQVRAIATVATAVTAGDLTQQITVGASGEVAELKDNINRMIGNLKETTRANEEQDWLKTNLARISGLMQGHRDFGTVSTLILSELAPLVNAQHGAFFLSRADVDGNPILAQTAAYGRVNAIPPRFKLGESLVGQAAQDKKTILVNNAPPDYIKVVSALGATNKVAVIMLPLLFEGNAVGVIELSTV